MLRPGNSEYGPEDDEAAAASNPLPQRSDKFATISLLKSCGKVLDFGDLEHYSLKILDHPEAVEHYSMRWNAFLVDEFQDTNPIQTEILSRLTANAKLTIVGDEKQAIYGFRGADIGVFSRVREEIVTARSGIEVPLSLTFRTHHELVLTMNTIFEPVLDDLHQALDADRTDRPFALHMSIRLSSRPPRASARDVGAA
ncbi:MAG: UvrD-helicase domain-containing protein [Acidobacteria bacterium]|nr:UvrD-helicase domain-containing protein [Acidobacteriota bacterium]